ncbi:MAG: hypothetical protein GWM90_07230, partial [Gemmatimonadetes bacterium]|nr:hypothetical protein [Gemmatimonadota bacterium]NIQ53618.1 hypothetical protein [Gemmatimonadota bacterium]NIU73780.1 hypothetical protein [Gammaproteobacteria bacterium]NIX43907.1 hypothetical protein [Gemmatimonadota bacterium]NIY08125.1 hypothetical protein [Gemmatimonadota bacterium]
PLGAQSITSLRGLGDPLFPADARTEILGGIGVGLQGLTVTLTDPAGPAGLRRRGAAVSVAAVERTSTLGDASDANGSTRFPLIRLLYPIG